MTYDYTDYVRTTFGNALDANLDTFRRKQAVYTRMLQVKPGEHVLDVGGGSGQLAAVLAADGAYVTVLDISADGIDFARQVCRHVSDEESLSRISFIVQNLVEDPMLKDHRGPYDRIVSVAVWEHLTPESCHALVDAGARYMKDDGKFHIFTHPNRLAVNGFRWLARIGGHRGGYAANRIHVNEQSYWSLRRTLGQHRHLHFTYRPYYHWLWLHGEARVALKGHLLGRFLLPICWLASAAMDALYVASTPIPPLHWVLCKGIAATGVKRTTQAQN